MSSRHKHEKRRSEDHEESSKRHKSDEEFTFERHKQELNSFLKRYDFIFEYDEFWAFLKKYQKMKQVESLDHFKLIFFHMNVKMEDVAKRVTSRSLTTERLKEFFDIVLVYLNFQHVQRYFKLKKLRQTQKDLPVAAFQENVVDVMRRDNVLIVAGDTGCGKSTQIPQFLLKGGFQNIVCTQPRRLACISLCSRLKYETLNQYNNHIGYQIRFEKRKNKDTKILFLTEGLLLRQVAADSSLSCYDVIILDEVHERHLQSDFLLGLLKCLLLKRTDLKLVLMSATINIDLFSGYFDGNAQVIEIPGRLFPVRVIYKPVPVLDAQKTKLKIDASPYLQILQMIDEKYKSEKGDVLIFVSGMAEIMGLVDAVREYNQKQSSWIVLPLHSSLSLSEQDKVFDYAPDGYRKCIISTNIAETSITIDGIRFVVDSGKVKEMSYDSVCKIQRLKEFWISRSSAEQRKGRAGRTGPGVCYRIYSEEEYSAFENYTTPEIKRVPLDSVLLQIIAMGLPDVRKFPFLEEPNKEEIENCVLSLKQQNALTDDEKITEIGKTLTNLPVDITIGKMLITGSVFRQIETTIILASALSVQSPFTNKAFRDLECENARKEFESDHGDPATLLGLYRGWLDVKDAKEDSRRWCRKRGLEEQRFYEMTKLRQQFREILTDSGLLEVSESKPATSAERRIRHGEVKLLHKMRKDLSRDSRRKKLKPEAFEIEEEKSEVDIKDIEFRLKNDNSKVRHLLRELDVSSYKDMIVIKIIFCSGLYPQFAVPDEFNYCKTEQVFHTRTKSYVFLHPFSFFGLHTNLLKLEEPDLVSPVTSVKYCSKLISSKHQVLCYLNLLETNKIYLTNMMRMPALQTFLFFSKDVDTSFNFSRIVCDNWVLFEVVNPRQAEILVMKLVKLRKKWNSSIECKLSKKTEEEVDLTGELLSFLSSEIVYCMKRLLPADLKYLFVGGAPFEIHDNPFDPNFVPKANESKGGMRVTEFLNYSSVLGQESEDVSILDEFHCGDCGQTFHFNCFQRIQHREQCRTPETVKSHVGKKSNSLQFHCENCQENYFFTSIEVLKHKKRCKPK